MSFDCVTCGEPVEDIIQIVKHDCDRIVSADQLSSIQKNLLLYIESQLVDNRGKLSAEKMNHDDFQELKVFQALDLLDIEHGELQEQKGEAWTHKVIQFSDDAWKLAHDVRKARGEKHVHEGEQ